MLTNKEFLLLLIAFPMDIIAQEMTPVTGVGGSSSYMVEQVVYFTYSGNNDSVYMGIQQPSEILTISTEVKGVTLGLNVYPNLTMRQLNYSSQLKLNR